MARRKKGELFTLSRFTNSSGSTSWRVAGTWPPGNPVRRNFKEKADAIEALAALEADAAGAEDLQHLQRTILSTEQLSDAEAAIQSLEGARLSQVVGHYLTDRGHRIVRWPASQRDRSSDTRRCGWLTC